MKKYRVRKGTEDEGRILWLTEAQVVEYRRQGYYVTEVA